MTKMTWSGNTITSPNWAGDFLDPDHLVSGSQVDPAGFTADAQGRKPILSGTMVGRTYAEQVAGTAYGPLDPTGGDEDFYLTAFDVTDAADLPDVELYRHGSIVKEDLLPEWGNAAIWTATAIAQLRANYATIQSAA